MRVLPGIRGPNKGGRLPNRFMGQGPLPRQFSYWDLMVPPVFTEPDNGRGLPVERWTRVRVSISKAGPGSFWAEELRVGSRLSTGGGARAPYPVIIIRGATGGPGLRSPRCGAGFTPKSGQGRIYTQ